MNGLIRHFTKAEHGLLPMILTVVLACIFLSAVSTDSAGAQSPSPASGKAVLRLGNTYKIDTLNPFIANFAPSQEISEINFDRLVDYNPATLGLKPALATSWSTSPDGKVWTFNLRKGVKWSDGQPFTAKDVAFTYNTYLAGSYIYSALLDGMKRAVVVNDHTVKFVCSRPMADLLGAPIPIVPEHIWGSIPVKKLAMYNPSLPLVGTGPFQVVAYQVGTSVTMKANKQYWGGAPGVDELVYTMFPDPTSMAEALRTGAIQAAAWIPGAMFPVLKSTPGITAVQGVSPGFQMLGFNCYGGSTSLGNPVLRDPAFRRALNYAVNEETIAKVAYSGYVVPQATIIANGLSQGGIDWAWQPPAGIKYTFNLAKAGQLLNAAGYKEVNGARLNKAGKPIVLRLITESDYPPCGRAGKLIVSWFGQLGIKVQMQNIDSGAMISRIYNFTGGKLAPDDDMFIWNWSSVTIDPDFLLSVFTSPMISLQNDPAWSNAEYDHLFALQSATLNPKKRQALVWKMQEVFYQQTPSIILGSYSVLQAWDSRDWSPWVQMPSNNGGILSGAYWVGAFSLVKPVTASAASSSSGGPTTTVYVAVGIVIAALAVLVLVVVLRRRGRVVVEE